MPLSADQAHYLFGVMRLGVGDPVLLFNGRDGEWRATIVEAGRRRGGLECEARTREQSAGPDLWLVFAPLKKARTDFVVEKATELGASLIQPVLTEFTNSERIRRDRLQAHAVEAAEQCNALAVPQVTDLVRLETLLADWPSDRHLLFCDESRAGAATGVPTLDGPGAILIGPEGGFSERERERLENSPFAHAISLGPRILRADTAAVSALTIWQVTSGDWR